MREGEREGGGKGGRPRRRREGGDHDNTGRYKIVFRSPTHHLIRTLLGGLLQLLESGDPAIFLCLVLSEDEHLTLEPHAALLVAQDLEDGRDELGASVDDVVGSHSRHLKVLVPEKERMGAGDVNEKPAPANFFLNRSIAHSTWHCMPEYNIFPGLN